MIISRHSPSPRRRSHHSHQLQTPTIFSFPDNETLADRLDTDTTVDSTADLSPVTTLCDLAVSAAHRCQLDAQQLTSSVARTSYRKRTSIRQCPEAYDVSSSVNFLSQRTPFTNGSQTPPPTLGESGTRPRSVLFEPMMLDSSPSAPASPYSKSQWLSTSCHQPSTGLFRARQSVSSIGSCSTVQTRSVPVKSILTRHDSGISMATTRRKKKRSPPSVKFVDAPTVHYDHGVYLNTSPPCSPPASGRRKMKTSRWLTMWWKRSPGPPPRPTISGPYNLSYSASLVDVYNSRSPKPVPGRLKRFWIRVTKAFA